MPPHGMRLEQHEAAVRAWNDAHPIGTAVMVSKDNHSVVKGITETEAYMLGDHTAVIRVSGIRGCYALDRVTADKTVRPTKDPDQ